MIEKRSIFWAKRVEPQKQIAVQLLMVKEDTAPRSAPSWDVCLICCLFVEGNHVLMQDFRPEKGICNICTYLRIPRKTTRVNLENDVH